MRKVIDELIVSLNLDISGFKTGMKAAKTELVALEKAALASMKAIVQSAGGQAGAVAAVAKKAQAEFVRGANKSGNALAEAGTKGEEAGAKIKSGMDRGGFGALSLLYIAKRLNEALGFPMLLRMSEDVIKAEASTARLAASLKLNSTELQAWQMVIERHGGTRQEFDNSISNMTNKLGKLGTQLRGAKMVGIQLGLTGLTEQMVKGKDALAVLTLFANQMHTMSTERQLEVGKGLGLDRATIQALQEGGPAILAQLAATRKLAASQAELAEAKKVAIAQEALNQSWERAKQVLVADMLPVIEDLIHWLEGVTVWVRENKDLIVPLLYAVAAAVSVLGIAALVAAAKFVIARVAVAGFSLSLGDATSGISSFIGFALSPLGLALVAAAGGFILLNQYLAHTKGGMDDVADAARGMDEALQNGYQKQGERFKREEAQRLSYENYYTGLRKTGTDLRNLEKDRKMASVKAGFASMAGAAVNNPNLFSSYAAKVRELDNQIAQIKGQRSMATAKFQEFDDKMYKQLGRENYYKFQRGRLDEAKAVQEGTKIDTVHINVNSASEAAEVLEKFGAAHMTGGGGIPAPVAVGGGMG